MEMKNVVKQKQVDTLIDSIRKLWQGTLKDPKDEVNMEETLAWIEALHTSVIDKDIYG